jgi:hypothetical protein
VSDKGSIYRVSWEALQAIKYENDIAWNYLIENVRKKEGKKQGRHILSKPIDYNTIDPIAAVKEKKCPEKE